MTVSWFTVAYGKKSVTRPSSGSKFLIKSAAIDSHRKRRTIKRRCPRPLRKPSNVGS
jgi:hypothetical protein